MKCIELACSLAKSWLRVLTISDIKCIISSGSWHYLISCGSNLCIFLLLFHYFCNTGEGVAETRLRYADMQHTELNKRKCVSDF